MEPSSPISDKQLFAEAMLGSEAAFRALFDRYYDAIHGYTWKILRDESGAEDATQQVFIKVAKALQKSPAGVEFKPWVYKVALNTARDQLRARERYQRRLDVLSVTEVHRSEEHHRFERITEMLEKLPDEICQTVLLVFGQGLTQKESALVLGCPIGTVSWRISEARKFLRMERNDNVIE